MTTKYVARLDGQIIGKRTTQGRSYSHAVIGQLDVEVARDRAYNYKPTATDKSNFKYKLEIVACEGVFVAPEDTDTCGKGPSVGQRPWWNVFSNKQGAHNYTAEDVADAKRLTAGGWEGYVAIQRQDAIERFERDVKDGSFNMHALTWCGRLDLARKQVSKYAASSGYNYTNLQIVPAEVA